jgi:phage terminase large subunit
MNKININKKYTPLFKDWGRYAIISGGRGSGKSFVVATYLVNQLCSKQDLTILYLRLTMVSTKNSIVK